MGFKVVFFFNCVAVWGFIEVLLVSVKERIFLVSVSYVEGYFLFGCITVLYC